MAGKKGTVVEASVVVAFDSSINKWFAMFLYADGVYPMILSGEGLSQAQRNGNVIASGSEGGQTTQKVNARSLFE